MDLKVTEGISPSQILQLIKYSNTDNLILKTTQDNIRFKDKTSFKEWFAKKRKIYSLVDRSGKLHGIAWFGNKKIPDNIILPKNLNKSYYGITFAIRIYEGSRGKGLAKKFMKEALTKYRKTEEFKKNPMKGIWLVTNSNNLPAISAYKRIGFKDITLRKQLGRVIMVLD